MPRPGETAHGGHAEAFSNDPEDIRGYLEKLGGLDEFRLAKCACGSRSFRLLHDDVARRICTQCAAEHLICDSEDYWEDSKPVEWTCRGCEGKTANLGVGFVLWGRSVDWLTIGQRCEKCGRLDNCVGWESAGEPSCSIRCSLRVEQRNILNIE